MGEPKTSESQVARSMHVGVDRTCLVALAPEQSKCGTCQLAISRHVDTIRIDQLNAFELLNHRYLVVDKASLDGFPRWKSCFGDDNQEAA